MWPSRTNRGRRWFTLTAAHRADEFTSPADSTAAVNNVHSLSGWSSTALSVVYTPSETQECRHSTRVSGIFGDCFISTQFWRIYRRSVSPSGLARKYSAVELFWCSWNNGGLLSSFELIGGSEKKTSETLPYMVIWYIEYDNNCKN